MSNCFDNLRKEYPEVSDKLLLRITDVLEKAKKTAEAGGDMTKFEKFAIEYMKDVKEATAVHQKIRYDNQVKKAQRQIRIDQFNNKTEGILSLLSPSALNLKESKVSVETTGRSLERNYKQMVFSALKDGGLLDHAKSGAFDKEIYEALHVKDTGNPPAIEISETAKKIADVYHAIYKEIYLGKKNAGLEIGRIKGYSGPQTHDAVKVSKFGKTQWIEHLLQDGVLDHERTFANDAEGKSPEEILSDIYDSIVNGKSGIVKSPLGTADNLVTVIAKSNLGERATRGRALHFNNGLEAAKYNEQFGKRTAQENLMSYISRSSKDIASAQVLGTDPESAINAHMRDAEIHPASSEGKKILGIYRNVTGTDVMPADNMYSKSVKYIKMWEDLTKLGNAMLSSFGDQATLASLHESMFGNGQTTAFFKSIVETTKSLAPKEKKLFFDKFGMYMEDVQTKIAESMASGDLPGAASALHRLGFKLSGLEYYTHATEAAAAKLFSNSLADLSLTNFDKLPERTKRGLESYGIDKIRWGLISNGVEEINGRNHITPEGIKAWSETSQAKALIQSYLDIVNGDKKFKLTYDKFVTDSINSYRTMISDLAITATGAPNARIKWILQGDSKTDTALGAVRSLVGQFKAFPLMVYQIMSRQLFASGEAQSFKELFQGKGNFGDMKIMAHFVASSLAINLLVNKMKKAARADQEFTPEVSMEEFNKSLGNSLGIFGDMLVGDYYNSYNSPAAYKFVKQVAGPSIADALDTGELYWSARQDLREKGGISKYTKKEAIRLAEKNVPLFGNHFLTKGVMQEYIFDSLRDANDPTWKKRQQYNLQKKKQKAVNLVGQPFGG